MNIEHVQVSDRDAGPYGVVTGPDRALWFTLVHRGAVARLEPGGEVTVHELDPPTGGPTVEEHDLPAPGSEPHGLTVGPDGAVWVALETGALARLGEPGESPPPVR